MPGAVPNAALWWGVRFDTQPQLRVEMNGIIEVLTLSVLTDGTAYYMNGPTQFFLEGLPALLLDMLRTHSQEVAQGGPTSVQISLSSLIVGDPIANTRLNISTLATGNLEFDFSHPDTTLDARLFGFAPGVATGGGTDTIQPPNLPSGLWYPGRPTSFDSRDIQPILGGIARSLTGQTRVSNFGTGVTERTLDFQFVGNNRILREAAVATEPHNTFEEAWLESIGQGVPFRLAEDETNRHVYTAYQITSLERPYRREQAYNILWRVDLALKVA